MVSMLAMALALAVPLSGSPPPTTEPAPTPVACGGSTTDPDAPSGAPAGAPMPVPQPCVTAITEPPQPSYSLTAAPMIWVGEEADFYATGWAGGSKLRLCYQVGSSIVGCATSNTGWFHLTVRRGSMQFFTVRVGGKIYARAAYRNGKLVN
jgi:hypothetical protein